MERVRFLDQVDHTEYADPPGCAECMSIHPPVQDRPYGTVQNAH